MNKETLKKIAVKTESEQQSRIIVELFEAAGFEAALGEWDYEKAHKVSSPYVSYDKKVNYICYNTRTHTVKVFRFLA